MSVLKKAAIYVRVSTAEQNESGYSVGEQRERLLAYCKAKGYLVWDVYVDGGYTGSNLERPGIEKLLHDMDKFDIVVVYKLDRLSRSQFDILNLIEKQFLPRGIDFVSMSEAFDTSTPFGRAMVGILGVFAQLEREQIAERMTMGRRARAKEGKYHGGGSIPIGYDYAQGKLTPNPYEAGQIRMIFEMVAEGKSNLQILEALNNAGYTTKYGKWKSSARISRTIKIDTYIGNVRYDDIVHENAHEPIIDKELFEKANAVRKNKLEIYGKNIFKRSTLLAGLIWCAKCGARYGTTISGQFKYHACYSRAFPKSKMAKQQGCDSKIWRVDALESLIDAQIKQVIFDENFTPQTPEPSTPKSSNDGINHRIIEIDKQTSKLMELYSLEKMPIDAISEKISELHDEKAALQSQIVAPQPTAQALTQTDFKNLIENISLVYELANIDQKRAILASLIRKISINTDFLTITWTFGGQIAVPTPKPTHPPCPACHHHTTAKQGKTPKGEQRYICKNPACPQKTFRLERGT